jgi:hypothetical protein
MLVYRRDGVLLCVCIVMALDYNWFFLPLWTSAGYEHYYQGNLAHSVTLPVNTCGVKKRLVCMYIGACRVSDWPVARDGGNQLQSFFFFSHMSTPIACKD